MFFEDLIGYFMLHYVGTIFYVNLYGSYVIR